MNCCGCCCLLQPCDRLFAPLIASLICCCGISCEIDPRCWSWRDMSVLLHSLVFWNLLLFTAILRRLSRDEWTRNEMECMWGAGMLHLRELGALHWVVLFRETERLWENWLVAKTTFPSPQCNMSCARLVGASTSTQKSELSILGCCALCTSILSKGSLHVSDLWRHERWTHEHQTWRSR